MANKLEVISYKYLPTRLPITFTMCVYLLMDKFQPSQLWQGVFYSIMVIIWLIAIIAISSQKTVAPVTKVED